MASYSAWKRTWLTVSLPWCALPLQISGATQVGISTDTVLSELKKSVVTKQCEPPRDDADEEAA